MCYLSVLTIFLNYYIIPVDTTLNDGTKSGTEVSSFNIYLMCVSFFIVDKFNFNIMFHVKHSIFILNNFYNDVSRGTLILLTIYVLLIVFFYIIYLHLI